MRCGNAFRKLTFRTVAEATMGVAQVIGQLIGSTTLTGACVYEALAIGWWIWMVTGKMWGFLPLNTFGAAVSTYTLFNMLKGFLR